MPKSSHIMRSLLAFCVVQINGAIPRRDILSAERYASAEPTKPAAECNLNFGLIPATQEGRTPHVGSLMLCCEALKRKWLHVANPPRYKG